MAFVTASGVLWKHGGTGMARCSSRKSRRLAVRSMCDFETHSIAFDMNTLKQRMDAMGQVGPEGETGSDDLPSGIDSLWVLTMSGGRGKTEKYLTMKKRPIDDLDEYCSQRQCHLAIVPEGGLQVRKLDLSKAQELMDQYEKMGWNDYQPVSALLHPLGATNDGANEKRSRRSLAS